jgi:hypothetical protein
MHPQPELPHEMESKRMERAQVLKLVWTLLGANAACTVLFFANRHHPSSVLGWGLFATILVQGYCFYRLARAGQELKPVLPPEMEAKRIQIAKRHNSLCVVMLAVMFVPWVGVLILPYRGAAVIGLALLATFAAVACGIPRIIRHDDEMCRRLGYMCPICHKPLYEPRAATYLTGICPKCKKSILAVLPAEPASA